MHLCLRDGFRPLRTLLRGACALTVLGVAAAGAAPDFGGETDRVLALAAGSATEFVIHLRNPDPAPITVQLGVLTDALPVGPQWQLEAAGDCASPPQGLPGGSVPVVLPAGSQRACVYRVRRALDVGHGLRIVYRLTWPGQTATAPALTVRVGDVTAISSTQQVLQWAIGDQPGRVRITVRNAGPMATRQTDYAVCAMVPGAQPLQVVAGSCEAMGPSACGTGMLHSGLRFGGLAVGDAVSCEVQVRGGRFGGVPLQLDLRGPQGQRMHVQDVAEETLLLRGTLLPQQLPWARPGLVLLLGVLLVLGAAVHLRRAVARSA